ncbi:nucleotidyltransferase domain-containing protein [Runella sp.]|uniref:nucleotidyltransferase domain-containing protein n=1 Tax=Runella sp. TaxID=1960881 RepID=UPI003D0CEE0E
MSKIEQNILAALAYFDMWDYPLTYHEIFLFLENKCAENDFSVALNSLITDKLIFQLDKFYSLKNDASLAERRINGNKNAQVLIRKAEKVARLLIKFPYVRGVGISGSLSKNFADEHSDIDLFIITEKNRLWIARTLMHFFKKLTFLVGRQHYFCMNYYVDELELEIAEKNIYTAIEIATILPMQGKSFFEDFYKANAWTRDFLPNKIMCPSSIDTAENYFFKRWAEKLFNHRAINRLDDFLMKITAQRWQQKTLMKKLNLRGTVMSMAAGKHCAKPDPASFQHILVEKYQRKLALLLHEYDDKPAQ